MPGMSKTLNAEKKLISLIYGHRFYTKSFLCKKIKCQCQSLKITCYSFTFGSTANFYYNA